MRNSLPAPRIRKSTTGAHPFDAPALVRSLASQIAALPFPTPRRSAPYAENSLGASPRPHRKASPSWHSISCPATTERSAGWRGSCFAATNRPSPNAALRTSSGLARGSTAGLPSTPSLSASLVRSGLWAASPTRPFLAWARGGDRWWRRAALVSTVPLSRRGGTADVRRTTRICRLLASDRDDMVVKAVSWALRELTKRNPASARAFIASYRHDLTARVIREVENKLRTGLKSGTPSASRRLQGGSPHT
jgi:hypothetical protein